MKKIVTEGFDKLNYYRYIYIRQTNKIMKTTELVMRAFELQERVNRAIDVYGECSYADAIELERMIDSMSPSEAEGFIELYNLMREREQNSK